MKALILNSGMGKRMGVLTSEHPKCLTEISATETILSRQLHMLLECGVDEVVMTTGYFDDVLVNYCNSLGLPIKFVYVKNPIYDKTNYIYSMFCAKEYLDDDIILMHGDIVFEYSVLDDVINFPDSCMVVSSKMKLPEKDFKAVIHNGRIEKVGIEFFNDALSAQPLYKLTRHDMNVWMNEIAKFVENNETNCYAEKALNLVSDKMNLVPMDVEDKLCQEIDCPEDLSVVSSRLHEIENKTVYMCFSTDFIHSGHIAIIKKAQKLGKLIIGVMTDLAVASYKRYPFVPYEERKAMLENIVGVSRVVPQDELSYRRNLEKYKPDYVVHGDDWQTGYQKPVRDEVIEVLSTYGGKLVEYPYSNDKKYQELEARMKSNMSLPDIRRNRLKKLIGIKGLVTAIEAHSGLTGLIAENTKVFSDGKINQFDAMWISSLCDSTAKGKPDIELVDMTSRFRTIDDIMEVTTKPIIFDGDTGGLPEHFAYTVRSLERMGVSMVIIEDKKGLKKNSLFGTEVAQTQASIEEFCEKIMVGKKAQKTQDFMICARIESLILEAGMDDALKRAKAFVKAGADAIMIHSRKKDPSEIIEFVQKFRADDKQTPIVVVPTSFNQVYEAEFKAIGVNVVIYANQLTRSAVPSMQKAAETILKNHRALECDEFCMPFKEIIRLIPEEV